MNKQRSFIYKERKEVLQGKEMLQKVEDYLDNVISEQLYLFSEKSGKISTPLYNRIKRYLEGTLFVPSPLTAEELQQLSYTQAEDRYYDHLLSHYKQKREQYPPELFESVEIFILLQTIDTKWKEHLLQMDHLREGINLRSYGEKKPLNEFKKEGFKLFQSMLISIHQEAIEKLFQIKTIRVPENLASKYDIQKEQANINLFHQDQHPKQSPQHPSNPAHPVLAAPRNIQAPPKVGRNDPCPCGSGRKYKHCHGKL